MPCIEICLGLKCGENIIIAEILSVGARLAGNSRVIASGYLAELLKVCLMYS